MFWNSLQHSSLESLLHSAMERTFDPTGSSHTNQQQQRLKLTLQNKWTREQPSGNQQGNAVPLTSPFLLHTAPTEGCSFIRPCWRVPGLPHQPRVSRTCSCRRRISSVNLPGEHNQASQELGFFRRMEKPWSASRAGRGMALPPLLPPSQKTPPREPEARAGGSWQPSARQGPAPHLPGQGQAPKGTPQGDKCCYKYKPINFSGVSDWTLGAWNWR